MKKLNDFFKRTVVVMLSLSMIFTSLDLGGFKAYAADSYGDDFNISTILSDFQFFTREDANVSCHTMGAVAVGGTFNGPQQGFADYAFSPSYINNWESGVLGQRNYPDTTKKVYYDKADASIALTKDCIQNPDYMDVETAFNEILVQSKALADMGSKLNGNVINLNGVKEDVFLTIDVNQLEGLELKLDNYSWFNDHALVISVVGVNGNNISDFPKWGSAFDGDNFKEKFKNDTNAQSVEYNLSGFNFFWNFPDASGVINGTCVPGHLVAPDATYSMESASYQGGIICKNIAKCGGEGHFLPCNVKLPKGDKPKGKLSGYKVNEEGTFLSGVKFGLYSDSTVKNLVADTITDENGYFEFTNVEYGEYWVKEISTLDGYYLDDKIYGPYKVDKADNSIPEYFVNVRITTKAGAIGYKFGENKEGLAGAVFTLYSDANCTDALMTATSDDTGMFVFENIDTTKGGTYYVKETTAPKGYILSSDIYKITFVAGQTDNYIINSGNPIINIEKTGEGKFSKKDNFGNELPNAKIVITSLDKKDLSRVKLLENSGGTDVVITSASVSWTSTDKPVILGGLPDGSYVMHENDAPAGYNIAQDVKFKLVNNQLCNENGEKVDFIQMTDEIKTGKGIFSKVELGKENKELENAKIEITGTTVVGLENVHLANGSGGKDVVITSTKISWTSTDKPVILEGLPDGTYKMHENDAPAGYNTAEDIEFKLVNNVLFDANGNKVDSIVMKDEIKTGSGKFEKVDIAGEEVVNATIEITSSDADLSGVKKAVSSGGNLFSATKSKVSWVSTDKAVVLEGLPDGTYVMTETQAPDGYKVAEAISFKLINNVLCDINGKPVDSIKMVDELSTGSAVISKQDLIGNELPGAVLTLTSKNVKDLTKIVKTAKSGGKDFNFTKNAITWTSTDKPAVLEGLPDGDYVLTEDTAPLGYELATAIDFKLVKNVLCDVNGNNIASVDMKDAPETGSGVFSKKTTGNKELPNAELTITSSDVADLSGVTRTTNSGGIKFKAEKDKISWTSTDVPVELEGLPNGTYTLHEDTAPEGYNKASDITFKLVNKVLCDLNGNKIDKIVMIDKLKTGSGVFSKVSTGNRELPGAAITITSSTVADLSSVTKTVESGGKDYVATTSSISWISTDKPVVLEGLLDGTYTMHENDAPVGYEIAEDITFIIRGNLLYDMSGKQVEKITMVDQAKKGTAEFAKLNTGNEELPGAKLKLTSLSGADMSSVKATTLSGGKDFVYDSNSVTWVTTEKNTFLEGLLDGKYELTEVFAPLGYEIAESIKFKLINNIVCDENGNRLDKIVMYDAAKTGSGEFSKKTTGNDELPGASLSITNLEGKDLSKVTKNVKSGGDNFVASSSQVSWTSTDKPAVLEGLPDGVYIMHEDDAPLGYNVAEDIKFMLVNNVLCDENGNPVDSIKMIDEIKTGTGKFTKLDNNGLDLKGATIWITSNNVDDLSKIVKTSESGGISFEATKTKISWITTDKPVILEGLPDGTYVMHEESAPEGYEKAQDVTFKLVNNVLTDVNGNAVDSIKMVDELKTGSGIFSKKNTGNEELPGATIQITSKDVNDLSNVTRDASSGGTLFSAMPNMISWISTDKPVILNGLPDGEYVMHEEGAPEGYQYAEDIIFRLNKNVLCDSHGNKVDMIVMFDEAKTGSATISKQDIAGKELADANITITSSDVADLSKVTRTSASGGKDFKVSSKKISWTSTTKPLILEGLPDGTYTLHEDDAPAGYEIAEDITFKMIKNIVCDINGNPLNDAKVIMVDKAKTGSGIFSKQNAAGDEVEGATLSITSSDVADLSTVTKAANSGGNLFSAQTKEISWISTDKPLVLENLPFGEYVMKETNAPEGYEYAEEIKFKFINNKIYVNGNEVDKLIMVDELKTGNGVFSKKNTGNDEVPGAKLRITSSDVNDLSKVEKVSGGDEFKAAKDQITWTSTEKPLEIKGLPDGTYVMHEDYAPEGYDIANEIVFKLVKNVLCDSEGKPVDSIIMVDEYKTAEGIFSKQNVTGDEVPGATLKLTTKEDIDLSKVEKTSESGGTLFSSNKDFITWVSTNKPVYLKGLPDGTYTLSETNAPEGYKYADDITFTIKGNEIFDENGNKVTKIIMVDEANIVPDSFISKKSTEGELPGARLTVKSVKGDIDLTGVYAKEGSGGTDFDFQKFEISWTSTDKTTILSGLPDGEYIMSEDCAPAGYEVSTSMKFKMIDGDMCDENGKHLDCLEMIDAKLKDPYKSSLSGYKTDGSKGLAGAVIGLYSDKSCTKEVSVVTSSSDGLFTFADLEDGTYYVKEVKAPEGYEINSKVFGPYDCKDGKSTSMTDKIVDKPYCALQGKKVDDKGNALEGATIGLYSDLACTKRVQTAVSKADGVFTFDKILPGTYYVKEITPPSGYKATEEVFGPYLVDEGKTVTMEKAIVNNPSKSSNGGDDGDKPDDDKPGTGGNEEPKGKGNDDKKPNKKPNKEEPKNEENNKTESRVEAASEEVKTENARVEAANEYIIETTQATPETTPLEKKVTSKIKSPKTGENNAPLAVLMMTTFGTLLAGIYATFTKRKKEQEDK